jgi:hypothetical protein
MARGRGAKGTVQAATGRVPQATVGSISQFFGRDYQGECPTAPYLTGFSREIAPAEPLV